MSYTELEHGYQDLRSTSRPIFYVGDLNTVQPDLGDPVTSSFYRSSKRGELSDGCSNEDGCMGGSDLEGEGKQVLVGVCAMAKKSQSKPMKEILTRLEEFEYIKIVVFPEEVILKEPVEDWPIVDCLISFHSKGFPLDKAIHYANLRNPFIINNLPMQYDIQDRRRVYAILDSEGIEIPRYAVLDRDSADPKHHELVESEDHVEVNGVTFNKPFVEKPVSAEDHNIYIYYPTSAGGGSQRLFRKVRKRHSIVLFTSSTGITKLNGKAFAADRLLELIPMTGIGSRSSVYSPESRVRKTGSYIYEDFMPTDGTDVKVYTVGPDYAHAEARKSPALDGKVERDSEGKEIRYPVILSNAEKLISRKVCLAFKQTVCGFDLLRANGKSFVCDVNGFSFVKNSNKYYDDCAKILGNMILRELAPTLHIPWSVPFQLDDPPIVPTTFGKMMELRCVVAVIRHGDRTPKQKMKVEVRHPKFFEIFAKYDGYKHGHVKLKRPKQLQEILDTARSLLTEIQHRAAGPELEEKQGKLEQLKSVLEMYGHFSGINRKVQMKYQPRGRPRGSSSDDGNSHNRLGEPSLVLILKWGGELTPAGRIQAEELGRIFRCMYPGGQGRHLSEEESEMLPSHGEYAGAQGLGLLRLHSTFRHDLKIYASDEGRVQMTAAAFAKGLLALEGELTPILVQMVKSANTNGLLDNDCDSSKYQNMVKTRLHELLQQDREFTREDREQINPGNALSINDALDFVKNPVKCCQHVQVLIQKLMDIVRIKKDDPKTKDAILYHGETWELMGRRWGKIEKDFCTKNKRFDISKIPDIYDCIKYDLQHNNHTLQFDHAEELYIYAKYLADIVIPQEYGLTVQEKLTIGQGICTPLLKKIRADLQRNIEESGEETVNRLNPRYSHGVSSPGRHVRTRLYFTSESHVHSLLTVLRYGGLLDVVKDEQWRRAMEYVSMVSELNYMSQIVVMLYEDPTKDPSSEERFHVELHFSPGVNCCVQKNLPPGPGFRPHSRNESSHNLETNSQCSTRIDEEDAELGGLDDGTTSPQQQSDTSPILVETEETPDTTLDSPTTSRAIDMMDLDPNMMDEPYDSGFLQASAPIPISARTVAGHEAARLGSQLAASQRQRREREASGICEPRARSYDHQRQEKTEKPVEKLQYQSLDAVNKEGDRSSHSFEIDDLFYEKVESLVTPKNRSVLAQSRSQNNLDSMTNASVCLGSRNSEKHLRDVRIVRQEDSDSDLPLPSVQLTSAKNATTFVKNTPKMEGSTGENSSIERKEFWDFGETQILEKRFPTEEHKISSEKAKFYDFKSDNTNFNRPRNDSKDGGDSTKALSSQSIPLDRKDYSTKSSKDTSESEHPSNEESENSFKKILSSAKQIPSITRSPGCLGIPVSLPHSVSSPELPAPITETILATSRPVVATLNLETLRCSSLFESSAKTAKISIPSRCVPCNSTPTSHPMNETKPYGRSKSALALPIGNDPSGESELSKTTNPIYGVSYDRFPIDKSNCQFCTRCHSRMSTFPDREPPEATESSKSKINSGYSQSWATFGLVKSACTNEEVTFLRKYSTSSPPLLHSSFRRRSLDIPVDNFRIDSREPFPSYSNSRRASLTVQDFDASRTNTNGLARPNTRYAERSRSLSPCTQPCQCYNCNVSTLIRQSITLPPAERSNFETYFVRSLSHKSINCRCYKMCIETAKASRRMTRSASPNSTSWRQFQPSDVFDHPFAKASCLDLPYCPKYDYRSSTKACSRHIDEGLLNIATNERLKMRREDARKLESLLQDPPANSQLPRAALARLYPACCKKSSTDGDSFSKTLSPILGLSGEEDVVHCSLDSLGNPLVSGLTNNKNIQETIPECPFALNLPKMAEQPGETLKDRDPRNILVEKTRSNRRLPRQSSCPLVLTDSSSICPFGYPLSRNCDCCNCIYSNEYDLGLCMTFECHCSNRRSSSTISSKRFSIPNQSLHEDETGLSLLRKLSCPSITGESSSFLETPEEKDTRTKLKSFKGKYGKQSEEESSYSREYTVSKNERDVRNDETVYEEPLGKLNHRKVVPRQASCPEMVEHSEDSACHSLLHSYLHDRSSNVWKDEERAQISFDSPKPLMYEKSCCCSNTANNYRKTSGIHCEYPISRSSCLLCLNHNNHSENDRKVTSSLSSCSLNNTATLVSDKNKPGTFNTHIKDPKNTPSSSSHPRIQTQRSFSSPDTRPSIIQQPDPTCTARRHRHSISGQMSYFKLLGYNVSKKLTGSTNSLFSTAVISGSSSAPNLKDMVPPHASAVAAIEGFGGVPPIRPLETLHNALSLRQLDSFLDMMTNASLFRTPASSPPKFPSPGGSIHGCSVIPNLSICNIDRDFNSSDLESVRYITPAPMHYKTGLDSEGNDNRNQLSPTSPNSAGWSSEPQSFLSSGPSSPAPTSAGECSMSISLVSNDGTQPFAGSKVSTSSCLDMDFNDFCRNIDQEIHAESRGSISYTDYYSNEDGLIRKSGPDLTHLRERAAHDEMSQDSVVDDDEEHTLTLRETEEHRKQDVKFIFDQKKDNAMVKPSSSYKKIGRFRVESMEIADEDVRIKEAAAAASNLETASPSNSNLSLEKIKMLSDVACDKSALGTSLGNQSQDTKNSKENFATLQNRTKQKGKTIARSRSVSTPQNASRKNDGDYVSQTSRTNTGSFSTMSCEDLENWKIAAASPPVSTIVSPDDFAQEEPLLTVASSLKGLSNVVVGFNVQDEKKD